MGERHNLIFGTKSLPSFDSWSPDPHANYGGTCRKDGLIAPNGTRYMVKFQKRQGYANNIVSEYVASHVLGVLGYQVQETELGTLHGEVVVACRNFVPPDVALVEFGTFLRKHYDSGDIERIPNIKQVYEVLETDRILSPQTDRFKSCFWERFIADALVGNPCRYHGDFGYLVRDDGFVTEAPIYGNDGSLFSELLEDDMAVILEDPKEILWRARYCPAAALALRPGVGADYYGLMSSGIFDGLTGAVIRTVPRIRDAMPAAMEFVNGCGFLSDVRKDFYSVLLAERMHFILDAAYERCVTRQFDLGARRRVENGAGYSRVEFEDFWKMARYADGRDAADIRDGVVAERLAKGVAGMERG